MPGSMWWSRVATTWWYGVSRTYAEIAAATAAPPATGSEPPSQKSFWTSVMISARISFLEDGRDGGVALRQLEALPRHRHQRPAQVLARLLQARQALDRLAGAD